MNNGSKRWKQFLVAALASALASVFIVAVGPGFSSPNDNANESAVEATTETETEEVAAQDNAAEPATPGAGDPVGSNASEQAGANNDGVPNGGGNGDDTPENASTAPDSHGHVGAGTGTTTGSQADPGHSPNENATETDNKSIGDGRGDDPADECTNEKHQGANAPQGGANYNPGPYDNTCDGRISQNGQGSDAPGGGTPCAGCVGNADDMNPPGQVKEFEGKKSNDMGYECDGNQGVGAHYGNGNPAHTGDCGSGTTNPPTCPADSEVNANMPIPTGETAESFCNEDEPPTCPANSEVNGGMTIPEGETEASYCNNDDTPTCPADSEQNAGMPIPDGETEASYCNNDDSPPPPTPLVVCVPAGNSGNWTTDSVLPADLAGAIADGAIYPVPADGCPKNTGGSGNPTPLDVCVPSGTSGNWHVGSVLPEDLAEAIADGAIYPVPADGCPKNTGGSGNPTPLELCVPSGSSGNWHVGSVLPEDLAEAIADGAIYPVPTNGCPKATGGGGHNPVSVCHALGNGDFIILDNIDASSLAAHLAHGDTLVPSNGICSEGTTVTPTVDCNGDTDASNNHLCNPPPPCPAGSTIPGQPMPDGNLANCYYTPPPVCPSNSTMPGQPVPGNNVNNCYITPPPVCPSDSNMPGQPIPGSDVNNCYITPPPVCPAGSDMAGEEIPGGNVNNCYVSDEVCPAGTDMAGLPIPVGGISACDDEVLGGGLGNDDDDDDDGNIGGGKDDDVRAGGEGQPRKPLGGVLPFTGTSVLAYVLVGLQMIGAGALIARGRRRNNK